MNSANQLPASQSATDPERKLLVSVWRGFLQRCPCCNKGKIYSKYLKVTYSCQQCGEYFYHQRADDAPPYFTIFIVGHIIIPLVLIVEQTYQPSYIVHAGLWTPLVLLLTLILLPTIKGGLVALQWALYMHGFGGIETETNSDPKPTSNEVHS